MLTLGIYAVEEAVTVPRWRRYGLVGLAILASILLTFALRPTLGAQTHYLTFTLAVIVCAWYGGFGPGLAATIGGFLAADFFFIEPLYTLFPIDAEDAALLSSVGLSVSLLTERLARAQARLAVATSAAGIGIFEWDASRDRARWTPQFARLYGIDLSVRKGSLKDVLARLHPEDAARIEREVRTAIAQGKQEIGLEFRLGDREGARWIEARCRVVYSRSNRPVGIVSGHIDVTERRKRELERERLIQSEHTARLEAEQARKALAISNEDLQRFAYTASHDLKQPLRTIGIYTELLMQRAKDSLDEESVRIGRTIVKGVDQMHEMITSILRFCRATDPGEGPRSADANAILRQALQHLHGAIEESGARISFDDLPQVAMTDEQLLQVFLNLIGNAIKYRGERSPEISISASCEGKIWIFSVADNGIGIDPTNHERIFGFMQRLHTSQYEGVGIGLALVRRVVERAGGRIWVESEPGKGSIFRFTIPPA